VVLVGGFGTRLRPLTLTIPKQMLPVASATMLERVVAHLGRHGVTRAVLALGYQPEPFLAAHPDGRCAGVELAYAVEPEPLDTAGAIGFAARQAGIDDTFVVVNGDVLTDLDVADLVERHRAFGAEGTIALTPVDDPSRFGVVPVDDDGRVEAFIEKPPADEAPTNWINAGTYVLEPSVLDRIEPGRRVSIEREVFPAMVADRTLFAVHHAGFWLDAGTPVAYLAAVRAHLDGTRAGDPAVVDGARIDAGASVERSWIGAGAHVEAGARVVGSVVLPGARVGADASVTDSVVGPRAEVGPGAVVSQLTVVGADSVVGPGAVLVEARIPEPA
jgi:mannose-1-phosphate guanylyltransferase